MIRALRARHRAIWLLLALLLPLLLLAAVRARHAPAVQELPAAIVPHAVPADDAETRR